MKLSHDPTIIRELPQLAVATLNFTDVDSTADTTGRAAPFNDRAHASVGYPSRCEDQTEMGVPLGRNSCSIGVEYPSCEWRR